MHAALGLGSDKRCLGDGAVSARLDITSRRDISCYLEVIMNEFERRIRDLWTRITAKLSSSAKDAGRKRSEGAATLRREATAGAQRAAAKARDLRDTEAAKKAASALHDLREHEAAKKAEAAFSDLRGTETAKKAESALADLRQRDSVKKAEEGARKVLHDLFSGGASSSDSSGSTPAS
jgi:hypothetical protein